MPTYMLCFTNESRTAQSASLEQRQACCLSVDQIDKFPCGIQSAANLALLF